MQKLLALDKSLFLWVNNHLHNGFLDWFLPLMRNQFTWMPLYVFLIVFVIANDKKNGLRWVLAAAAIIYFSNYVSSTLIKGNVFRLRPCNDPEIAKYINFLIGYRPQSSSFTSSHATNHFTMASFIFFTLKPKIGNLVWLFILWAAIICFAQVYVGVHFPLDVVCGGIIGYLFGYLWAKSFNKRYLLT
jgi:membrane-associated phospholipid phosphatase